MIGVQLPPALLLNRAYDMGYIITQTAYSFCISYHFNSSTHAINCLAPRAKNDQDILVEYITLLFCLDCWTIGTSTHLATKVINWQTERGRLTVLLLSSLSWSWHSESDECSEVTHTAWKCAACAGYNVHGFPKATSTKYIPAIFNQISIQCI